MGLQRERDGDMISQGIGRGISQTSDPIGQDQMSVGEPMKPQLPFCPLSSIIHFFQKLVEAVNALGRARHGSLMAWLSKPASLQVCTLGGCILSSTSGNPMWECVPIPSSPSHAERWVHSRCWESLQGKGERVVLCTCTLCIHLCCRIMVYVYDCPSLNLTSCWFTS